jgi:hypothetical protein
MCATVLAQHAVHGVPFNSTFYSTVAAVIPVLFLAIVVQGAGYDMLLDDFKARIRAYRAKYVPLAQAGQVSALRVLAAGFLAEAPRMFAFAVLAAGIYGEGSAIMALYAQRDFPGAAPYVLATMAVLTTVAAAPPMVKLWSVSHDVDAEAKAQRRSTDTSDEVKATEPPKSEPPG